MQSLFTFLQPHLKSLGDPLIEGDDNTGPTPTAVLCIETYSTYCISRLFCIHNVFYLEQSTAPIINCVLNTL